MSITTLAAPVAQTLSPAAPRLRPERKQDAAAVESLIDRVFGPGRFAKTAERLREGRPADLDLSLVAWSGGRPVGCVRQWRILVGPTPAVFLGPIAVEEAHRHAGLGGSLIHAACEAARREGLDHIVLVGDEPLFSPYGFTAAAGRDVLMPGPVDRRRVLALALGPGRAVELSGPVRTLGA